ncbi:hypothetical protein CSPAE12_09933 [Colletotrichum incanum]|nr:hypothetical protein CSPAE12_09933 [Colletotrichum incanum]
MLHHLQGVKRLAQGGDNSLSGLGQS